MPGFKLGPSARLRSRSDFKRVFSQGRRISAHRLILWHWGRPQLGGTAEPHSPQGPRLGISISAKVGNAVKRNRLKRLVREAFRLNQSHLQENQDLVLCLRPGCCWPKLSTAERDIGNLWRKAGVWK